MKKDPKLIKAEVTQYNKPKALRNDPQGKANIVVAKMNNKTKIIKFGDARLGAAMKKHDKKSNERRKNFKSRFKKLIAKNKRNKFSHIFWADKTRW